MKFYCLSVNSVFRKEDSIIFDSSTFTVHELNETAIELIELIENRTYGPSNIKEISEKTKLEIIDIEEFFSSAIKAGFIKIKEDN